MTCIERFFLRRYRRRLLKACDGPFDAKISRQLEAVDALLDVRTGREVRL